MTLRSSETRYGVLARAIHWLTALLVLAAWLISGSWGRDETAWQMVAHQSLGMAVFILLVIRVVWRLFDRRPAVEIPRAMGIASRIVQGVLYVLLFAVPMSAIIGTQLEGHAILAFGLDAGPFLETSRQAGHRILNAHEFLGTATLWVAGLHAVAALFHHYVLKDGVLRSMLPGRA